MRVTAGMMARRALAGLTDLVYPPRCLLCDRYGGPAVCDDCYAAFAPIPDPVCAACGRPETPGVACRVCEQAALAWGGWGFDAARAAAVYEGALRHGLHRLKYRGVEELGGPLGAHLANRAVAEGLFGPEALAAVSAVVPVPLRPEKERARGFNQAALLAAPVAAMRGVPLRADLVRRAGRSGRPAQMGLGGDERRANVGATDFAVDDPARVAGRTLLLVDDVFTTGATVSACARALKDAGAARVLAVTLAAGD